MAPGGDHGGAHTGGRNLVREWVKSKLASHFPEGARFMHPGHADNPGALNPDADKIASFASEHFDQVVGKLRDQAGGQDHATR